MTQVFEIGTKVKYVSFGTNFTGTIHGHYSNNGELYYSVELDKKYQTTINLKGIVDEFASYLFLSTIVCHSGHLSKLKE